MSDCPKCGRHPLGRGTTFEREPIVIRRVKDGADGTPRFRITQTLHLEFTARIHVSARDFCFFCGAVPELDEKGAEFILAHNDGDRLHFPDSEECEEDRDRFPVTGWREMEIDDDIRHVCGGCHAETMKALRARAKRKR